MRRHWPVLPTLLVALAAHVGRFGYAYGDGDHDELIPSVLAVLDPALFRQDWLVHHVAHSLNVRSAFVWMVAGAGTVAPLPAAVAVLHGLVFLVTGAGIYALAWTLTESRAAALLGTFTALAVTPAFTLGANAVVYAALVPEGVAWALAVPAVVLFLRRHRVAAGVLLGVAAWMHLLTGLLPAFALGLMTLWRTAERAPRESVGALVRFGAAFAVPALPIVWVVVQGQADGGAASPSPLFIHAVFRNPFHHLLSAFPVGQHVRFWGLLALGAGGLWAMRRWGAAPFAPEVFRLWAVVVALAGVAAVFVEHVPVELVAKLQLFKLTVLAGLLATLTAAGGAIAFARAAWGRDERPTLAGVLPVARAALGLAGVVAALGLAGAAAGAGPLAARVWPLAHSATPLAAIEAWARAETPRDALFAVPPSVSTFRTGARRALVANWHAFVFSDAAMAEWFMRLRAIAPIAVPGPRADRKPLLDAAYAARSAADWRRLRARYGVDFVVARADAPALPFAVAHRSPGWTVYTLAGNRPRRR